MREVTRDLNTHMITLIRREKSGNKTPFGMGIRGRYDIKIIRP